MSQKTIKGTSLVRQCLLGWKDKFGVTAEQVRKRGFGFVVPEHPFPYNNLIGVEIEIEGLSSESRVIMSRSPAIFGFQQHEDPSLREGHEYVTLYGMSAAEVLGHLKEMLPLMKGRYSFRCGLHTHLNVQEETLEDLYKTILLYTVLEQSLFAISGNRDKNNKYCVPFKGSSSPVRNIIYAGAEGDWDQFCKLFRTCTKYQALNLLTVYQYGSLEFRHHEGTADFQRIENWIRILSDILYGHRYATAKDFTDEIVALNRKRGYRDFVTKCLPNSYQLVINHPSFTSGIYDGVDTVKEGILFDHQEPVSGKQQSITPDTLILDDFDSPGNEEPEEERVARRRRFRPIPALAGEMPGVVIMDAPVTTDRQENPETTIPTMWDLRDMEAVENLLRQRPLDLDRMTRDEIFARAWERNETDNPPTMEDL